MLLMFHCAIRFNNSFKTILPLAFSLIHIVWYKSRTSVFQSIRVLHCKHLYPSHIKMEI